MFALSISFNKLITLYYLSFSNDKLTQLTVLSNNGFHWKNKSYYCQKIWAEFLKIVYYSSHLED